MTHKEQRQFERNLKKQDNQKVKKSLKNRIRFIVNLSIFMTVFFLGFIYLHLANLAITSTEKALVSYYIEEIQYTLNRVEETLSSETLGFIKEPHRSSDITAQTIMTNRMFYDKMQTLTRVVPILSVDLYIDDSLAYQINANELIQGYFNKYEVTTTVENADFSASELKELQNSDDFKELTLNKNNSTIYNLAGDEIGSVDICIDLRIMFIIYALVILPIIFISIVVLILMRIITTFITKPILYPLKKLNDQLESLADENYENINPSIEIGKRPVKEVVEISKATNKLLTKMIKYNEVITQSEKMASIGQLTAAITHEINTPLGVINSNAGLMKMLTTEIINTTQEDERQMLIGSMAETADTTEEACSRIQEIIKSLRSYSRIDQADFVPANINESIKSVIVLTTNLHKNRIRIVETFGKVPDVSCYIGLINQVFMNVMINAIQSIEKEGTITILTSCDETYVSIKISDTGCGIEPRNFYRIFEYGFTTKQPGSGSGIGLALSKNIMNKHNGEILIDSEVGVGTNVTIKLPIKPDIEVNR